MVTRNQDFIGICGVYENGEKEKEIAFRIREKFWEMRIGGEIVKSLIHYCLIDLELDVIVAYVDEDNIGSVKILDGEMKFVKRYYSDERERFCRKYKLTLLDVDDSPQGSQRFTQGSQRKTS